MPVNYKIISAVVGASTIGAGVATPLVMNSAKESPSQKESTLETKEEQKVVAVAEAKVSVDTVSSIQSLPNQVNVQPSLNSISSEEEIALEDINEDEEDNQEWKDAVKRIKEGRENKGHYRQNRLTQKQREALKDFYERFSNRDSESWDSSYDVRSDLQKLSWTGDQLKLDKDQEGNNTWGWGEWQSNPFKHFYTQNGEETWKEKMRKYLPNPEGESVNQEVEAEIEFDIADWMLKEVERIYKKIRHSL